MLRNRKDLEEIKLMGVNRVADPIKLKLGTFFELQNWIPAKRYKIKKKRGPVPLLTDCSQEPIPEVCDDNTERGQQTLVVETRFLNGDTLGGHTRTSWSYIGPDEEVYTLVGDAVCGFGNMTYSDLCCQINHFIGPGLPVDNPPLIDPDGFPATNTMLGTSDEPCYAFANSAYRKAFFPATNTSVDFESPQPPFGNFFTFAKKGDRFYGLNATFGGGDPSPHHVWAWSLPDGSLLWESDSIVGYTASNASATTDFLYVLVLSGLSAPFQGIAKLDATDGSLVGILSLDTVSPRFLFTVNDNLIYILTLNGAIYYLKDFTQLVFVGSISTANITSFSGSGFFGNGAFYFGATGFGGFSPHIYKVLIPCPIADPLIAEVTTDATVAAGDDLAVSWSHILQTALSDRLYLKADDDVLFDASPISSVIPGVATSSGTYNFPIPGGTPPGSYVIQYVYQNTILVATSAPFTVT